MFSANKYVIWWGIALTALTVLGIAYGLKSHVDDRLPEHPEAVNWIITDVGEPFQKDGQTMQRIAVKNPENGDQYRITTFGHACFSREKRVQINPRSYPPDVELLEVVADPWCSAIVDEPGHIWTWIRDGNVLWVAAVVVLLMFGMAVGLILWLLPAYIAHKRKHNNFVPILIVDLCVGWTVLGMIACLAWAFSDNVKTVRIEHVSG